MNWVWIGFWFFIIVAFLVWIFGEMGTIYGGSPGRIFWALLWISWIFPMSAACFLLEQGLNN